MLQSYEKLKTLVQTTLVQAGASPAQAGDLASPGFPLLELEGSGTFQVEAAVPDSLRDEAVKAFVVVRPGETISEEQVKEWCSRHLSKFKVPSFVEFIPSLPKTSIGKIMKYVLKQGERSAAKKTSH